MNLRGESCSIEIKFGWQIFNIKTRENWNESSSFYQLRIKYESLIMSTPSKCNPKLTRQVCPVCVKFIEIHYNLLAQNNAIRVKSACMTLVQANCCSVIKLATKKSTNTIGSRERFASLPFPLT